MQENEARERIKSSPLGGLVKTSRDLSPLSAEHYRYLQTIVCSSVLVVLQATPEVDVSILTNIILSEARTVEALVTQAPAGLGLELLREYMLTLTT